MKFSHDAAMGAEGPCVVKRMGDGSLMAVCECMTMESARLEAMRLNSMQQLEFEHRQHMANLSYRRKASEATTRAGVRFFPNEG